MSRLRQCWFAHFVLRILTNVFLFSHILMQKSREWPKSHLMHAFGLLRISLDSRLQPLIGCDWDF